MRKPCKSIIWVTKQLMEIQTTTKCGSHVIKQLTATQESMKTTISSTRGLCVYFPNPQRRLIVLTLVIFLFEMEKPHKNIAGATKQLMKIPTHARGLSELLSGSHYDIMGDFPSQYAEDT